MNNNENWLRMVFKGNKVWAEKGADGQPLVSGGRVRVKYNLSHDQEYMVNPLNLNQVDESQEKKQPDQKKKSLPRKNTTVHTEFKNKQPGDEDDGAIVVYTDGASSGNPGPSGIGIYFYFGGHEKEISEYIGEATNNIAELEAIRRALSEIKNRDLPLKIYSDSSYALGLITLGWKPKKNQELVADIKKLVSGFRKIDFIKVEGHSGIPGNERADKLATGAIERHILKKA